MGVEFHISNRKRKYLIQNSITYWFLRQILILYD